jgi:hypothetical protein
VLRDGTCTNEAASSLLGVPFAPIVVSRVEAAAT